MAEIGPDPQATFGSPDQLTAWAGICPGNNESAGKRRSGHIRRGNAALRVTLVECAHAAARTRNCQFHGYARTLTARRGYKRAIVATAHKLLRVIYAVLRNDHAYLDPKIDYEKLHVKRNAPRWIRNLLRYNLLDELLTKIRPKG